METGVVGEPGKVEKGGCKRQDAIQFAAEEKRHTVKDVENCKWRHQRVSQSPRTYNPFPRFKPNDASQIYPSAPLYSSRDNLGMQSSRLGYDALEIGGFFLFISNGCWIIFCRFGDDARCCILQRFSVFILSYIFVRGCSTSTGSSGSL